MITVRLGTIIVSLPRCIHSVVTAHNSPRRPLLWMVFAVLAALLFVTRVPGRLFLTIRETRPGDRITAPPSVRSLAGLMIAPIAEESLTVVVVTTAECDNARLSLTSIAQLQPLMKSSGIAFRVVVRSDSRPARQYGRLLPDPLSVVVSDPARAFDAFRARSVPTLFLVGANGRVITRLPVPVDPDELAGITQRLRAHSRSIPLVRRTAPGISFPN